MVSGRDDEQAAIQSMLCFILVRYHRTLSLALALRTLAGVRVVLPNTFGAESLFMQ